MKDRYDGAPGKEAAIANTRQRRYQSQHTAKDNFVKKQQSQLAKYSGKPPVLKPEMMMFDANMQNNGKWAQDYGKKLTSSMDHVAFPVDGQGDDS